MRRILIATGMALLLAGCGLQLPVPRRAPATAPATAPTVTDNEVPTPPARAEHAPGAPTPRAAVTRFAQAYINWDAADVASRLTSLARRAVGEARSELRLEASETRSDAELHQGQIANRGAVESVARQRGVAGSTRYVVVTRERTTAAASTAYQGLAPAWHVTLATVRTTDHGRRWVVCAWQPQS